MGATCAPYQWEEDDAADTEKKENNMEPAETGDKLTNIINTYQAENEKMKLELESRKNRDEKDTQEREAQAAHNDEIMKELQAIKALMEEKDRSLLKHRLEAALHSKATAMVTSETVTKLLKAGTIHKFGRAGKTKSKEKWVDIHVHCAQITSDGITKGCLMLTYADDKGAQVSNRCQITRLMQEVENVDEKFKARAFSVEVISSGADKELAFACEDSKEKDEWVKAITDGFEMLQEEYNTLKTAEGDFLFDLEISKPKLGITIRENVIEIASVPEEKAAEIPADADTDAGRDAREKPCELVVIGITDDGLLASGLTTGCVIKAINGINLRGLTYSRQVGMFESTKKPYAITFLKKRSARKTAFPGILKKLVSNEDNAVKSAFYDLVAGTAFGIELEKSENKTATITELLSNQVRLTAVLQNTTVPELE